MVNLDGFGSFGPNDTHRHCVNIIIMLELSIQIDATQNL